MKHIYHQNHTNILELGNKDKINTNVYHNTKLLLSLYENVLWRINNDIQLIKEECEYEVHKNLDNFIDSLVDVELYVSRSRLDNRLRSIENSKSLVNLINKAMKMVKSYPNIGERYYNILYKTYIAQYKSTTDEMIDYLAISRSTYFREKKKAVNLLGTILWGYLIPQLAEELKKVGFITY
ncbi:hypothetical protein SH1V18_38240 [Vallitalea longa]|uniref:Uncharacterized protein n=1 Tax=Vallitalea longa TaxID=2936439 RepID=A0A9W5YG78_9FIRM|nr:DUF1492 domain-containing protein [Vallitalea longa]GKX31344.1 hypothetical protein SH1V18_38240 [Vallitalea longa]